MDWLHDLATSLPPTLTYAVLGVGAAIENLFPPVPADTFVLLGAFLSARGPLDPWTVFWTTWGCNVAGALLVYGVGRRHGRSFFELGMGRHILHEGQLERMSVFYRRWGIPAIFLTRFIPGLRAVVPVFAGVTRQPLGRVAFPLASASAIWYGVLVWVGATVSRNLEVLFLWLSNANRALLVLATVIALAIGVWWWRTRHPAAGGGAGEEG